eukprot:CAMPEP_0115115974 /NCGR_PEP_ID=MMETSP0227-20121206/43012_1 /TAXON_ID=89957 /ORGANISM="Polarella glacialis, Strain CCMP 1383" /LENGTH=485 /DNA_ID=CAMNT_0002516749 /DNA_START=30 /DNA_END=1487 /DNA_ORIENTATION=+
MTCLTGKRAAEQRRRRWQFLVACAAGIFSASNLSFLGGQGSLPQQRTFGRHSARLARHGLTGGASAAAYASGPGDDEWSPDQERAIMEEVLGRVPPASQETSGLASETRLLRQQTEQLVQEIRMLRETLRARAFPSTAPSTLPAASAKASMPTAATTPAPAPARSTFPAATKAPAPPTPAAPAPRTSFPVNPPAAAPKPAAVSTPPAGVTSAKIVSAGWGDGNAADFFLNGRRIDINGQAGRRGMNVVTVDPKTQQVTSRKTYDVWGDPATENTRMAADLRSLPDGRYVLVALRDSGLENLDGPVIAALQSVGAKMISASNLPIRQGYALIGVKGGAALAEEQAGRAEIEFDLPCIVRHPPPLPPEAAPVAAPMSGGAPAPFAAPTWAKPTPAAPPPASAPPPKSSFPTAPSSQSSLQAAAPSLPQKPRMRVPKLQVDPQGGVSYSDQTVEREAGDGEEGQTWQEVVLMLDRLQEKIKAKRLAGV